MGNITALRQGSLNGLRRQTNECLVNAYNKGYADGNKEGYDKGYEDGKKKSTTNAEGEKIIYSEEEMQSVIDATTSVEYNRGVEDLSKATVWYSNLKHSERVKYIGENLAIYRLIEDTPQKLIEGFKAYEENKQAEDKIKVGDIVRYATDTEKMIVTRITNATIETLDKNGCVETWKKTAALHKWGNKNVADKLQALFENSQEIEDE